MRINLFKIWNEKLLSGQREKLKSQGLLDKADPTLDDRFMQSSFEFKIPPRVKFVRSIETGEQAYSYDDLPGVVLTSEEADVVLEVLSQLQENPNFYDGPQLLVTNMVYDDSNNILEIEARRANYSFLRALALKRFPDESQLYLMQFFKTGVMTPFMTWDDKTFFLERSRDKLYSAASGFLEPFGPEKLLNPDGSDIVVRTAIQESLEEILGCDGGMKSEVSYSTPQISSLSIRQTENGLGTAEFIAPMFVNCHSHKIQNILRNNTARDRGEHSEQFQVVSIDPRERVDAEKFLETALPGNFLYHPMIASVVRQANNFTHGDTISRTLPCSRTTIIPLESLGVSPRALTWQMDNTKKEVLSRVGDVYEDQMLRTSKGSSHIHNVKL